jgi:hypothetical protein
MIKINALFLILVIMPFYLCSNPNLLEMIEKVPQAKSIMNAIHLQVKLSGSNLQQGDILKVLKTAQENADKTHTEEEAELKVAKVDCEADLPKFNDAIQVNQKWEFTVSRHLNQLKRNQGHIQAFISRTVEEKNQYIALSNIISDTWNKWQSYQNTTLADLSKVQNLLSKARKQLRNLNNNSTSFLQLNENSEYFTNLNEIRVNFENTFVELQGFRPLITKLFQLMANGNNIDKADVRNKLLALFSKISRELNNIADEIEANRAKQDSIFSSLIESYKENLIRIEKLLERLNKENNDLSHDAADLTTSNKEAALITAAAKEIFRLRKKECIDYAETIARIAVEISHTRSVVSQIHELMTEQFGNLKSYFIQRNTKLI